MKNIYIVIIIFSYMIFSCSDVKNTNKQLPNHEDHQDQDHVHDHNHDDHENHNDHNHDHEKEDQEQDGDIIILSDDQARLFGIEKTTVEPSIFRQVIKTSGKVLPAQGDEKTVVATTSGIVNFTKTSFNEGINVSNGETLVSINSQKLGEGDVAMKAKNQFEAAKQEFQRAENLIKYKLISQKDYNDIKLNFDNAKLAYNALGSGSLESGVRVTSPISGYLKSILVTDGQFVSVGDPLAVVTQVNKLQLRADVSQKHYAELSTISSANIVLPYSNEVIKLSDLEGQILSYAKSLDQNDFYIPINFKFNNVGNIIPGSFVEVYLLGIPKQNTITIPQTALLDEQGTFFVMVNLHEDEYLKKPIKIGKSDGILVEVQEGLNVGEIVVTKGAYLVKLAKTGEAVPHGHSH